MKKLYLLLVLVFLASCLSVYAGGPSVVKNGMAITYGSRPLLYRFDQGFLGMLSNIEARQLIEDSFSAWKSVPTALDSFQKDNPDSLSFDVTASNFDSILNSKILLGYTPVVFDTDGSLLNAFLGNGAGNSTLGLAGSITAISGPLANQIAESQAVFNGRFVDGIDTPSNRESSIDSLKGTIIHEFGHARGLGHSQINVEALKPSSSQTLRDSVPLMFPIGINDLFLIRRDDASAISSLYPNQNTISGFGSIEGKLFRQDGVTPVLGGNIIARNTTNPTLEAISCVSDFLKQGDGSYKLFVVPPGQYTIEIEPIDFSFTGPSGVGPYTKSETDISFQNPVPKGYYTGPNKPITSDQSQALIVTVTAGQAIKDANIIASQTASGPTPIYTCDRGYISCPNNTDPNGTCCPNGCCPSAPNTCKCSDSNQCPPNCTLPTPPPTTSCQSCSNSNQCSVGKYCNLNTSCCVENPSGCVFGCTNNSQCINGQCIENCCKSDSPLPNSSGEFSNTFTITLTGNELKNTTALNIMLAFSNPSVVQLDSAFPTFSANGASQLLTESLPDRNNITVVWSGTITDGQVVVTAMLKPGQSSGTSSISVTKVEAAAGVDITNQVTAIVNPNSVTNSSTASSGNEVEPNNNVTTAQLINIPSTIQGSASASEQPELEFTYEDGDTPLHDFFKFNIPKQTTLQVILKTISNSSDADLELYLFNDSATKTFSESINPPGINEEIVISLRPGTYLIAVGALTGSASYSLSIDLVTKPILNIIGANGLVLNPVGKNVIKLIVNSNNFISSTKCQVISLDTSVLKVRPSQIILSPKRKTKALIAQVPFSKALDLITNNSEINVTISVNCTNGTSGKKDITVTSNVNSSRVTKNKKFKINQRKR